MSTSPRTLGEMRIPIACSLDEPAAQNQVGEWRAVIARAVAEMERTSPTTLTLTLNADLVGLTDLVQLAQREKACCTFFEFDLVVDVDRVRFVVSVPEDAEGVLDEFGVLAADDLEA
jgi:hypothetical protein